MLFLSEGWHISITIAILVFTAWAVAPNKYKLEKTIAIALIALLLELLFATVNKLDLALFFSNFLYDLFTAYGIYFLVAMVVTWLREKRIR